MLSPFYPIGFGKILGDMCLEFRDFVMNDAENDFAINLEILMNEKITHIANTTPFHFGMS